MSDKPGRGSDQFPLRLPTGLRDQIKQRADANGRSMNTELVAIIEDAVSGTDRSSAELHKALEGELAWNAKTTQMLEAQFDLLADYKGLLRSSHTQTLQQASIITSLCKIVETLDPGPEVLEMSKKLAEASQEMVARSVANAANAGGRAELREIERTIAKADEFLSREKK